MPKETLAAALFYAWCFEGCIRTGKQEDTMTAITRMGLASLLVAFAWAVGVPLTAPLSALKEFDTYGWYELPPWALEGKTAGPAREVSRQDWRCLRGQVPPRKRRPQ